LNWPIFGLAAQALKQQLQPQRLALPSADEQVENLAGAASRHGTGSKDLVDLPDWKTVREMLIDAGEAEDKPTSLVNDLRCRYWMQRQLSDLYRAKHGDEPPSVKRGKRDGYVYPPDFQPSAKRYIDTYRSGEAA
jgi:hypothetical protein